MITIQNGQYLVVNCSVALRDCLGRKNALYKYLILNFILLHLAVSVCLSVCLAVRPLQASNLTTESRGKHKFQTQTLYNNCD